HAKVFRDRRATGAEISGELANGLATTAQQAKDLPPGRISDSSEDSILLQVLLSNHLVTVTTLLHRVKSRARAGPSWTAFSAAPAALNYATRPRLSSTLRAAAGPVSEIDTGAGSEELSMAMQRAIHVEARGERDWLVREDGGRELGHYPTRREA